MPGPAPENGGRDSEEQHEQFGTQPLVVVDPILVPQQPAIDVSSVITQVGAQGPAPGFQVNGFRNFDVQREAKTSWRARLSHLLCCFAPPNGYFRTVEPALAPRRQLLQPVIGPKREEDKDKKTLVLDLDETLVHSSFKPIPNPDYILPVEIDGKLVDVYVLKRPWLDHFMESIGPRFETIVFTASLAKYADPLLDMLDTKRLTRWRLFREACCPYEGNYVKDLTCLGRDLAHTIIVDNSPHSYIFQPANAIPIGTFIDDMQDQELLDMLPLLHEVEHAPDVRVYLGSHARHLRL